MSRSKRAAYSVTMVAGAFLYTVGALIILIAVHDAAMPEDLTTMWMCHQMGNQLCGPDTPWIQFAPANIFYGWDQVVLFWWGVWYDFVHGVAYGVFH